MDDNHLRIGKDKTDPLTNAPDAGKALFDQLNYASREFPYEAVINAAGNLLLNVLRQRNGSRSEADKDSSEMFGRLKAILMAHYDNATGRRRSVFPFKQVIEMPFMDFRKYPKNGKPS
jgi:hypothetical protein